MAATAVLTFAFVAEYIPIKPAVPEHKAPSKNDIEVCHPRERCNATMHTKQNIASRLYSADIKTIAPRWISSPISLTRPTPSEEDFTLR